jgi:hypothetical protein
MKRSNTVRYTIHSLSDGFDGGIFWPVLLLVLVLVTHSLNELGIDATFYLLQLLAALPCTIHGTYRSVF